MREPDANPGERGDSSRMLRVATWNMDHWKRTVQVRAQAWSLLQTLEIDVALLQETVPPKTLTRDHVVYRPIGGTRGWGSAVVAPTARVTLAELDVVRTRYSPRLFSMLGSVPGAVVVAQGEIPDLGTVTFVSVYGMIDVYAQTTMFRIVADLIPLFDSPQGQHVVLGGDFNVSTATNPSTPELPRYAAVLHAIEALGLVPVADAAPDRPPAPANCPCGQTPCTHLRTFGSGQLDYLYATPELARCCRRVWLPANEAADLSDHLPIVAEFDPTQRLVRTEWDTRSFAVFMAEQHGAAVGDVVENLLVWADRKQDELRHAGYRYAHLDRLPIEDRRGPELWFQLDGRDGRLLQWTCSLREDGRVVMQFQHMYAPFATETRRREIWQRLTQIPGIELEPRLTGRPSFPITTLTDEGRLTQFVDVLSFIVDETLRATEAAAADPPLDASTPGETL